MNRTDLFLATVLALTMCLTSAVAAPPQAARPDVTEAPSRTYAQNYRDMALAYCIAKAYESEPRANKDAMASAGGLDAWTRYDAQSNTGEIPKLVERFLARQYASIQDPPSQLNLLKCIDMYHSKELLELVRRYVSRPAHTYRQDNPPPKP